MAVYDSKTIPEQVASGTKDPAIAAWLKTGPVLGGLEPIHKQRRAHDALIDAEPPPIGRIEHLGIKGPHGTVIVRVFHPARPRDGEEAALPALVYMHGGGFVVGTLDQFDTAMRRLCVSGLPSARCVGLPGEAGRRTAQAAALSPGMVG